MRRLVFTTQKLDPADPVLAATVPMVRALAERVDELVVLCDTAVARRRCRRTSACTSSARRRRFSAARGSSVRSHASCARARSASSHTWSRSTPSLAAPSCVPPRHPARPLVHALEGARRRCVLAERLCDGRRLRSTSGRFPCARGSSRHRPRHRRRRVLLRRRRRHRPQLPRARARPLFAREGPRHDPPRCGARGRARSRRTAPRSTFEPVQARTVAARAALGVDARARRRRAARRACLRSSRESHVLVNNMRAGAPDKVVYEAAASCLPVLASNPVFDDLLPGS